MNVRDENLKNMGDFLNQLDDIVDRLVAAARALRGTVETIRRGMEVEAQLGRETHPPDPLDLKLEDKRDDD